jgi:hypothetical protein
VSEHEESKRGDAWLATYGYVSMVACWARTA